MEHPPGAVEEPTASTPNHHYPLLWVAAGTSLGTLLLIVGDISGRLDLPVAITATIRTAAAVAWIVWVLARKLDRLGDRLGPHMKAAVWADGYLHGVSRRTPTGQRVTYLGDERPT